MSSLKTELKKMAIAAMEFSYSPYSNKKIGASIVLSNGKSYSGCNIENASYGGTVCAERVAIWKAFSENKSDIKITEVFVASNESEPWPPCGFCRQVLAEFATPETQVTLINLQNTEKTYKFKDLLPLAFKFEHLIKKD
ncbi:cytidine deaminase [bacterium]|nr:cytidine deaminase [bacterium]